MKFFEAVKLISIVVLGFLFIRLFTLQTVEVVGDSMQPTFVSGDRLIADKLGSIKRFDVVILDDPEGSDEQYIKRVIGLPGDEVALRDNVLYINDQPIKEDYLPDDVITDDFVLREMVPRYHYFVLGDNRLVSNDSRYFGFVPVSKIRGTISLQYYPEFVIN